jgi:hypothetical protein
MAEYLSLLAIAIALTFTVGRILVVAGEPFLLEVFHDRSVTRSVNLLLSVLFHLLTLGALAIVSVLDPGVVDPAQRMVVRLGVVLLVLGVAYGVCMLVLIKVRERRRASELSEEVTQRLTAQHLTTRHRPQDVQA